MDERDLQEEPLEAGEDAEPDRDGEDHPAGAETESAPAGVGDGVEQEDQPGFSEDAPEVD